MKKQIALPALCILLNVFFACGGKALKAEEIPTRFVLSAQEIDKAVLEDKALGLEWSRNRVDSSHFEPYAYFEDARYVKEGRFARKIPALEIVLSKGSYQHVRIKADDAVFLNPPDEQSIRYKENKEKKISSLYIVFRAVFQSEENPSLEQQKERLAKSQELLKKTSPIIFESFDAEKRGVACRELHLVARGRGQLARAERVFFIDEKISVQLTVEYRALTGFYRLEKDKLRLKEEDSVFEDPEGSMKSALAVLDRLTEDYFDHLTSERIISGHQPEGKAL